MTVLQKQLKKYIGCIYEVKYVDTTVFSMPSLLNKKRAERLEDHSIDLINIYDGRTRRKIQFELTVDDHNNLLLKEIHEAQIN